MYVLFFIKCKMCVKWMFQWNKSIENPCNETGFSFETIGQEFNQESLARNWTKRESRVGKQSVIYRVLISSRNS